MNNTLVKLPFILLVAGALVSGILTGWYRLGFDMPVSHVFLHHGALMTGGFLGTVILTERIVALKQKWLFSFPIVNGSSVLFYFLELPQVSSICLIIGALGLFYVFHLINKKHSDLAHKVMWVGATAWFIGNVHLFLFESYGHSILWWMAFLLITITGERLELIRFLPVSNTKRVVLIGFLVAFLVGCVIPFHLGGRYLAGGPMLLVAIWLLRYDMVRKSVKHSGIHRYSAIALIFGYIWLAVSGGLFLFEGTGSIPYDALMHAFFLGFVFSMIFAHAPIILPGVVGLKFKPYHASLYVWVIMLQLTLMARLGGGFLEIVEMKKWFGFMNGITILLFIINLMIVTVRLKRKQHGLRN
ncbi:MAG: hypothetical protein RIC35_24190 [Marinoscillum sp.]